MKSFFNRIHVSTESVLARFSKIEKAIFWVLAAVLLISTYSLLRQIVANTTTTAPARGGSFTEGVVGAPKFINPVLASSQTDKDLVKLVYSGLLRKVSFGKYTGDLADCDFQQKRVTCVIREGAKFHDGKAVTSDDVVFTINLLKELASRNPNGNLWLGTEVTALDSQTISFTLPQEYSGFEDLLTLGILPKHVWEGVNAESVETYPANLKPIGSGPYKLTRISGGDQPKITLTRFARSLRPAFISRITIATFPDSDTLLTAVKKGSVDTALLLEYTELPPKLAKRTYRIMTSQIYSLFINTEKTPALESTASRIGLAHAIAGFQKSPLWPAEMVPSSSLLPGVPYSGTISAQEKDLAISTQLEISTSDSTELIDLADSLREYLSSQSIPSNVSIFERGEIIQQAVRNRNYSLLLFGTTYSHPADVFAFWHSSQRNDPGLNITNLVSTTIDSTIEKIVSGNPTNTAPLLAELESKLDSEAHVIPLINGSYQYISTKNLVPNTGIIASPEERFSTIDSWYKNQKRVFNKQ